MLQSHARAARPQFSEHDVLGRVVRVGRWHAEEPVAAPPLLFFSGIGANIELLAPFLEALRGRDVITFDMPGVGGSAENPHPYRLSSVADTGARILAALGVERADVMGVSWGGMLAQEFAYRHPQNVSRLILAATSAGMPMIPGSLSTLAKMVTSHRYTDSGSMEAYLQTLYGGSSRNLGSYAARIQAPTSNGYLHQLLAIAGWTSLRKLTRIKVPTLILMGAEDRVVPPANGKVLKFLLPEARLEVLEDAGHLFILTHMDAVAGMVEEFLGERSCPPAAAQPRVFAAGRALASS